MQTRLICVFSLLMALSMPAMSADHIKTHLTSQLSEAIVAYENALARCDTQKAVANGITLPVTELLDAKITLQELHSALAHYRYQAEQACVGNSRLALMSAILDLNSYTSDSPDTPIDPIKSGLALLLPSPIQLEKQAIYAQLPDNKIKLLDSIFKDSSPTIVNISNWQEAVSALREVQTPNPMNKAN